MTGGGEWGTVGLPWLVVVVAALDSALLCAPGQYLFL